MKTKLEQLREMRKARQNKPAAANAVNEKKYRVVAGYDYHRMPTVFAVINQDGIEIGRFPSEWEAQAAAAAAMAADEAAAAEAADEAH